ncbi:secreted RxLR effector peptide protein, putative [Phytophthora infestans T30-4]|uniref:Secreted RxLR effector peptide protein, putative n=2 Tax=Phytophthora infestans TaxID=4787 RepID=D0N8M8_PHYIT|nr:secreted RxLR effector peptide protein, putative [Phytophthora infestans T30-4]EEY53913.1 secreted RxLR effector peptide protein, putative [Phytophthora infestans T30-4]KAF4037263.1 RXLR phytopathogen effector protein [Phytophthora infestans]KAF4132145.1 RXLR phytopathogen effector protein [Phytophthora infestans]KAI9982615.1 hypothetical protein PInf_008587 [Phytophthora infestans]|eukprot:XP_002904544.1 secreted RxLR effector peptide protein, putative [Phytophthora infestans T30-4]
MRSIQLLIIALVAFLACCSATPAPPQVSLSFLPVQRRSLRTDTTLDSEDNNEDSGERSVWKHVKVRWWLETEKSDDFVRKALKLNGLDDTAMKAHKNYKYYAYFAKKAEDYLFNKWLRNHVPTFEAWKSLNLGKITKADQLKEIANTKNFISYSRFVKQYDDNVVSTLNAGYNPPVVAVARGASEAEITARTMIMASARRDDDVAKVLLGLTKPGYPRRVLDGNALTQHDEYKYYQLFKEAKTS